jgi:hypothetical protein
MKTSLKAPAHFLGWAFALAFVGYLTFSTFPLLIICILLFLGLGRYRRHVYAKHGVDLTKPEPKLHEEIFREQTLWNFPTASRRVT